MSLFKNKICSKYLPTIQNTLHWAKGFIDLEMCRAELARTREEVIKDCEEREEWTTRHEYTRTPSYHESLEDQASKHK